MLRPIVHFNFRRTFTMAADVAAKKQKMTGPLIGTHKYNNSIFIFNIFY